MQIENKQQILERQKEIDRELLEMLEETKSDFTLEDIKKIIYNEEERDDFNKIFRMFDCGQGLGEMDNILEAVSDAWNYFPHKCLGGISPAENFLKHNKLKK